MNESRQNALEGVRTLWPYLGFLERMKWCKDLAGAFWEDESRWPEIAAMMPKE